MSSLTSKTYIVTRGIQKCLLIHPQAVADNRDELQDRIDQTIRRLEVVNAKLLEADSDATSARMLAFSEYVQLHTGIHTAGEMIEL